MENMLVHKIDCEKDESRSLAFFYFMILNTIINILITRDIRLYKEIKYIQFFTY